MDPEHQTNPKTILIADDDHQILQFVSKILAESYNLLIAGNGKEALEQSRSYKQEIHLLLTDFEMPDMNGIELATAIRVVRPDIKVLLMSGSDPGMLVLNEGWHFLAKPFIASQLLTSIADLIGNGMKR